MNKIAFFLVLILATAKLQAQDYQISFAGSGTTTTVEAVQVQNLTQGTILNLEGSDVLHLMGTVGIEQFAGSNNHSILIYPNPVTGNCTIGFEVQESGLITIELFDITGKKVKATQYNMQAGTQAFSVSGLNRGIYTVIIKADKSVRSGKIISIGTTAGPAHIELVNSTENFMKSNLKSTKADVPMQYTSGDLILLKAISGYYCTFQALVPVASSTVTFNFIACTDYDGNDYATVTIGTQVWMAENLKATHYRNGDPVANVTDNAAWTLLSSGAWCWYNNSLVNKAPYGALYNWFTVADSRQIAPEGWHVPTDAEWSTLVSFLDGESLAGGNMKKTGSTQWLSPNTGATNECGFSATPAGYRYATDGTFHHLGYNTDMWSITSYDDNNAWFRSLANNTSICSRYNGTKNGGSSIRCVRD